MDVACECVEIRVYWGAWPLHTAYVPRGQRYAVGEGPAVDLPLSAQQLGVPQLELVNARGEVTLLRDGAPNPARRLQPSERQSMSCGMLRFEAAATTLPRVPLSERVRRGAQRMLPLLLMAVAVVVALPLALPLALGHELSPPPDEPTEEQRAYILSHLPSELTEEDDAQHHAQDNHAQDDDAQDDGAQDNHAQDDVRQAMSMLPDITVIGTPAPNAWKAERDDYSLGSLVPLLAQSHNPLDTSMDWPVTRYSFIELLHSGPPGAPIAQARLWDTWGACSCEIRNHQHHCGTRHALDLLLQQGRQPGFINWDASSWHPRQIAQLSGLGIGENPAGRGHLSLAMLHAPGQWQPANETRYHACMLAADCRGDAPAHDRCLAEATASTTASTTASGDRPRTAQRDGVVNLDG